MTLNKISMSIYDDYELTSPVKAWMLNPRQVRATAFCVSTEVNT